MAETAIVVLAPEADPSVGRWQRTLTQAGSEGLGAHVTLLVPFADSDAIDDRLSEVESALAPFGAFECALSETGFFDWPGHILFLRPEPREKFLALIESVLNAFPEFPAYGGEVSEIVPHLTVARLDDNLDGLRRIEAELAHELPIHTFVDKVTIIERIHDRWRERTSIPLG